MFKHFIVRTASIFCLSLLVALPALPHQVAAQAVSLTRPIAATPTGAVWPWEGSDLKPGEDVTYGVLPNGMRYAIRPNKLPEKQVSLRFRIEAGSKYERDDQRGFAHFIEHMAFNGSTNIPEGELTKTMERLGASFGSHVNAHVNLEETMYKLDIPSADGGRLDTALSIFRETADRLLLKDGAIKREIGVVISELNDGDGPGRRVSRQVSQFLYPDDLGTRREPIGAKEIVESATAAKVREFYETWYRPERTILVISGDVDVEATKALIAAKFSDWKAKTPLVPPDPNNGFWSKHPARAKIIVEPEQPTVVSINLIRPNEIDHGKLDTRERRNWIRLQSLSQSVFQRRLTRIQLTDNPPTLGVYYGIVWPENGYTTSLGIVPRNEAWKEALKPVALELRQALATGFTAEEIDEELKEARLALERAVKEESTRRTTGISGSIMGSLGDDYVATSAQDNLALFDQYVSQVTPDLVNRAFASWWQGAEPSIILMSKVPVEGGEAVVLDAWNAAMLAPLPKREVVKKAEFKPLNLGPAGKVQKVEELAHPKAKVVIFENGVRLSFMHTDYTKDRANIRIGINSGHLAFPQDDPYWPIFADAAWGGDGIGDLTLDQSISVFAGRSTTLASVRIDPDTLEMYASPAIADLPEQLQVMLSQVVEPRLGPRPALMLRDSLKTGWDSYNQTAAGVYGFYDGTFFQTGNPAYDEPNLQKYLASDDEKGKAYLKRLREEGTIHVVVVGDAEFDSVVAAVAKTFGTLPKRPGLPLNTAQLATIRSVPTGQPARVLTHKGPAEQAIVHVSWRTSGGMDPVEAERMDTLGEILQLRLTDKVREAAGQSYSPNGGWTSTSYADLGRFYAHASVTPDQVKPVEAIIDGIAADLVRDGVSLDELKRVIEPAVKAQERSRQNNGYWSSILSELDTPKLPGSRIGFRKDREAQTESRLQAITPAQLHEIAKRYLLPQNTIRIQVLPEKPASSDAKAAPPKP